MKVLGINGSPKGLQSDTHIMMRAVLKGFESSAAEITDVFYLKNESRTAGDALLAGLRLPVHVSLTTLWAT